MPRGGPDASWLDRRLQTDTLEYTNRYDISDDVKQKVITALDQIGTRTRQHEKNAHIALDLVSRIVNPRILELGAGHGKLSAEIVRLHPTATVTVSDLDPTSVANIAAGELGRHPRVHTQVVDATAIDAPDGSYDLVVFAQAFHHLPPAVAARAIAEATRVGKQFLVIDLARQSPAALILTTLLLAPSAIALVSLPSVRPLIHDGSSARYARTAGRHSPHSPQRPLLTCGSRSCPASFALDSARPWSRSRATVMTSARNTDAIMNQPGRIRAMRRAAETVADGVQPLVDLYRPYVDGLANLPRDGRFLLVGNHTQFGAETVLIPYVVRREIGRRVRPLTEAIWRCRSCAVSVLP